MSKCDLVKHWCFKKEAEKFALLRESKLSKSPQSFL